jgi:DNA-binding GntR family transcriptional regulator
VTSVVSATAAADAPVLIRAARSQLKDQVYQELKQAIVDLRLAPGQPLREAALSAQLGVSKTPVREALVRLQEEGLVTIEPYRGASVSTYSPADLVEIYELRELLEGACARHAATAPTPAFHTELARIVKASQRALRSRRADREAVLTDLFDAFDESLLRQMANGRIRGLLENLRCHVVRIGRLTVHLPGRLEQSVGQHAEIAAAIRDGDPDASEAAMRHHVRSVMDDQLHALGETD